MKTRASEAEKLRQMMARRAEPRGRMSGPLRERAAAYTLARAEDGATVAQIAREIGVSEPTITRWKRRAEKLVAVRVVEDGSRGAEPRGDLVVTTRSGLRIEGLDLDAVCTLIARCG